MEKLEQRPEFAAKVGISFGTRPLSGKNNDRKEGYYGSKKNKE
jgi:hypothetical protein